MSRFAASCGDGSICRGAALSASMAVTYLAMAGVRNMSPAAAPVRAGGWRASWKAGSGSCCLRCRSLIVFGVAHIVSGCACRHRPAGRAADRAAVRALHGGERAGSRSRSARQARDDAIDGPDRVDDRAGVRGRCWRLRGAHLRPPVGSARAPRRAGARMGLCVGASPCRRRSCRRLRAARQARVFPV